MMQKLFYRPLRGGLFAMLGLVGLHARAEAPVPPMPALAAACLACHGAAVAGSLDGAPRLAGKNPQYLAHALGMFKAGTRASPVMQSVARTLTDDEIASLAAYFSTLRPPRLAGPVPDAALVAAGQRLAETGAGVAVPACFSCHGGGGKGDGARFPSLVAEPPGFIVARLHEFQERARQAPPPPGSMTAVASRMDEDQIRQAAAYLSQLDP